MSADPVRDEAERLVAAAIAAVSMAARGLGGISSPGARPNFANGSPECCVCPVCRVIAAMREPSPDLAERLATGAGDLASGVTSLLRAFSKPSDGEREEASEGDEFWESLRRRAAGGHPAGDSDPWHTATTRSSAGEPSDRAEPPPARPMAKKAVAKKAVAKKAAAQDAAAQDPVAQQAVPRKPVVKKAVVKKAVAKKAVKKAAPSRDVE